MLDDFPDDLRPVVHNHWGKFPPQHPLVKDAFGLLFGMLFVVAFLGNSCVIYVFAGTKRLRTPVRFAEQICLKTIRFHPTFQSNLFIVNLAFSDLCMYTTQAFPLFINTLYSSTWMYGALGCRIYGCIGGIFGKRKARASKSKTDNSHL